jgi:tryptophanyl-tRNA synthetase
LPVILAITLHEAAHGYAARHFGDPTAWQAGRITANPLKHIDPVGTILVPAIILLLSTGGILFGWAKPVPVDFGRLRHPKRDMLWVAAAGPAANFAMLLFWAALLKLAWLLPLNFFSLPMAGHGQDRHVDQPRADGAQPVSAAAARWRADRRQPAAATGRLALCAARALRLSDPAAAAVYRRARFAADAGDAPAWRAGRSPFSITLLNRRRQNMYAERVLSGMRPTGSLHLGHYHGVLKNWVRLQHEYPCLFFVADWHALTTQYDDPQGIVDATWEMVIDWLAAGVDPARAILFIQSQVPEHAELHLLLSMMTPLGWLERVPTYKDQQEKLENKDLSTYGFLGYPLLQSADILIYRADKVPVGEDQVPHIEFSRELARRFNHLYGREPGFAEKAREAVKKLGAKRARRYEECCARAYQQQGEQAAIERAQALLDEVHELSHADRERLARLTSKAPAR